MAERSIIGAKVQGYCPCGCGQTLFLAAEGYVTCAYLECPCPTAVSDILGERETEHIVVIARNGFSVLHPLRERVEGALFDCGLHAYCEAFGGPPRVPGRYRALERDDGEWDFVVADAEREAA